MNKTQLIDALTPRFASRADAERALTALLDTIEGAVARDDKVSLPGFGTFERRARAARTVRNPQTGETMRTTATHVPAFRPGTGFRNRVATGKRGKAALTDAVVGPMPTQPVAASAPVSAPTTTAAPAATPVQEQKKAEKKARQARDEAHALVEKQAKKADKKSKKEQDSKKAKDAPKKDKSAKKSKKDKKK